MPPLEVSGLDNEKTKDLMKYATDFYKSEIDNFWKRSLFFWGFIAVAFIAYGGISARPNTGNELLLISCFGFGCSVAWSLLNRGSKYWYEAWEQKVRAIEGRALGAPLFSNIEELKNSGWFGAARFSVSKITVALSDFAVLTWLALGSKALISIQITWPIIFLLFGTLVFVCLFLFGCRSSAQPKF